MEPVKLLVCLTYLTLQPLISFIHPLRWLFHPCNHRVHGAIILWPILSYKVDCSVHLLSNFSLIMAKCLWRTGSIWPVGCEFGPPAKYPFVLSLYKFIVLFLRVLFIYVEFLWDNYTIKIQTWHFFFQWKILLLRFINNF